MVISKFSLKGKLKWLVAGKATCSIYGISPSPPSLIFEKFEKLTAVPDMAPEPRLICSQTCYLKHNGTFWVLIPLCSLITTMSSSRSESSPSIEISGKSSQSLTTAEAEHLIFTGQKSMLHCKAFLNWWSFQSHHSSGIILPPGHKKPQI